MGKLCDVFLNVGDLAVSLKGHDTGRLYVVIASLGDEFVLVSDGKYRPVENPKTKRRKHLSFIRGASEGADEGGEREKKREPSEGASNEARAKSEPSEGASNEARAKSNANATESLSRPNVPDTFTNEQIATRIKMEESNAKRR